MQVAPQLLVAELLGENIIPGYAFDIVKISVAVLITQVSVGILWIHGRGTP